MIMQAGHRDDGGGLGLGLEPRYILEWSEQDVLNSRGEEIQHDLWAWGLLMKLPSDGKWSWSSVETQLGSNGFLTHTSGTLLTFLWVLFL